MRVLPLWADGGQGPHTDLSPRRHLIAAYPSSLRRASLEALGPGGLEPFLRACLPTKPGPLPLVVVALAFDAGRAAAAHASIATRPQAVRSTIAPPLPEVIVAHYDGYLEAERETGPWRRHGETKRLEAALAYPIAASTLPPMTLADPRDHASYFDGFAAIMEGLAAGDFYQVNLARELEGRFAQTLEPPALAHAARALHQRLRQQQPAAFGALWPLSEDAWLVSGSPECLLQWHGPTHVARSFPIKGTIARAEGQHDAQLAQRLRDSQKDQAEHIMIVDLVRNDLGRVARAGGVSVPQLMAELSLPTVRHLVSEVRAEVDRDVDLASVIGALFPGGSITGAPKIAAIRALERHEPFDRGFYCGSLGVVRGGESATLSILIRTAVLAAAGLVYGTGGGLVVDSIAEQEFAETTLKATALARAVATR